MGDGFHSYLLYKGPTFNLEDRIKNYIGLFPCRESTFLRYLSLVLKVFGISNTCFENNRRLPPKTTYIRLYLNIFRGEPASARFD